MTEIVKEYFINPFLYLFVFSLSLFFIRRFYKVSLLLVIVFFCIVSSPLTYNLVIRAWSVPDKKDFSVPYDIVLVSSGVVNHKWYRSGQKKYPGVNYIALNGNKERIFAAISLLKSNRVNKLYFGDLSIDGFSETEVVRSVVLSQGIESERFVTFGEVNSSRDEAKKFRSYFEGHPPERFLLITSEVHMRRALDALKKQGLYPDTLSVDRSSKNIRWKKIFPSPGGAKATQVLLYEIFGWIGYYFQGAV